MIHVKPVWGLDYKPGTVLFLKNEDNLISRGIAWFENIQEAASFKASHVAFVVDEYTGLESSAHGIQSFKLSKYFDDKSMTVVCRQLEGLDELAFQQAFDYGHSIIGKPYDYIGLIIGFPLMILSPLDEIFPILRKLPLFGSYFGARVCSSFVADQWKHTERYKILSVFKKWHVTKISPNVLWVRFPWVPFSFMTRRKYLMIHKRGFYD